MRVSCPGLSAAGIRFANGGREILATRVIQGSRFENSRRTTPFFSNLLAPCARTWKAIRFPDETMRRMVPVVPTCSKCGRAVAAWRLDHCIYCGTALPPDFREKYPEPKGLKLIEPAPLPPAAARQLELMKVMPTGKPGRSRTLLFAMGLLTVPVFAILFYLMYGMLSRYAPGSAWVVALAAVAFLGYIAWVSLRTRRR
jgi:hypothetical protein